MSTMDAEVFEAFRSVGVADDKAILAAQALGRRDPDISTLKQDMSAVKQDVASMKQDIGALKIDVASLKQDMASLKPDVSALKHDVATLKTDVALMKWMLGFVLAALLTLLFKSFHVTAQVVVLDQAA
jgi:peptidoglycan hydrolase CwlO-like protein